MFRKPPNGLSWDLRCEKCGISCGFEMMFGEIPMKKINEQERNVLMQDIGEIIQLKDARIDLHI